MSFCSVIFCLLLWIVFQNHFFIGRPQIEALSKISVLLGGCQTSVAPRRAVGEREEEKGGGRRRERGRRRGEERRKRGESVKSQYW